MIRVACVLAAARDTGALQKTGMLLRPWLLFHGYLFGLENLYVCTGAAEDPAALGTLREFAALGVNLDSAALEHKIGEIRRSGRYDVTLGLTCEEFVAIHGADGIGCHRTQILAELSRIALAGLPCPMSHCLESQPGRLDLFRHLDHGADILPATDPSPESAPGGASTSLILIRLRPGNVDLYDGMQPLLRFSGLESWLRAFGCLEALQQAWAAFRPDPPVKHPFEVDLDRHPFRNGSYLEANADMAGLEVDPLTHFLVAGYLEGRRMSSMPADLDEVLERMALIRDEKADGISGYVGLGNALQAAGRAAEGDAILEQAIRTYGATAELVSEYASLSMLRLQFAQAARRWDTYRCLFPHRPEGYHYSAVARRLDGDLEGADAVISTGLKQFPEHAELSLELADIEGDRGDWVKAHSMYQEVLQRQPDNPGAVERISLARYQIQLRHVTDEQPHPVLLLDAPVNVAMTEGQTRAALQSLGLRDVSEMRDFFLGFESLGHSCEFGLVQRRYGAEPLGLLRWNSIHAHQLIKALNERFAGIDEADNLELIQAYGEYVLQDSRYHTAMHTFHRTNEVDADTLMRQLLKRTTYLRGKLIADLEQGDKIFVHLDDRALSDRDLEQLGQAMRAYGPNRLLYVRVADRPAQVGTLESVSEGLLVGYIDRLGRGPGGTWDISFESWLALCREAARVRQGVSPVTAAVVVQHSG